MKIRMTAAVLLSSFSVASGQVLTGLVFEDIDRDGVHDPGEPVLPDVPVILYGADGSVDVQTLTDANGIYSFNAGTGAEYVLDLKPGAELRMSFQDLGADPDPIPDFPQGRRRPGVLQNLVENLRLSSPAAPIVHVALGDSIAYGFNLCDSPSGQNDYVTPFTGRLDAAGSASLDKLAVLGQETRDLLDAGNSGSLYAAIQRSADLVTISIGGNDFLSSDGNEAATAANLVAARQNLQEILSTLVSRLPYADIVLNTVYDNEDGDDSFHNRWGPIWNQALRDVAWGQRRRIGIAEIWPDYSHLDPATNTKLGEMDLICWFFGLDAIHPTRTGYDLHEHKLWQGAGGLQMAAGSQERNFGYLRKMATRFPTQYFDVNGGATQETEAFMEDGVGAQIPAGNQELRLQGFDATPRGLLHQVVVNVRYRTTASPNDDYYRFEASVDGTYSAPGSSSSTWNTRVPIVGSSGIGAPVLAYKDQPGWREVSALISKGSGIDGSPTLTWQDLATLSVRVVSTAVGSSDPFVIEWDVASIDLYGVPSYRLLIRGEPTPGGTLQFDITGRQGDSAWLLVSPATGNVPFPPYGTFQIDLSHFLLIAFGFVGPQGSYTLEPAIPNDPNLLGLTAYFQALVIENAQQKIGALTNLASITIE